MKSLLFTIAFICSFSSFSQQDEHLIKSIYFGGGSYYVDQYQMEELYHFIDSIPNAMSHSITIHSYTDDIGGLEYNNWLARMRSEMVALILQRKGYHKGAMEIKDFGMLNPVYDNSTMEGKLRNRRVDVIFWPLTM